MFRNRDARDVGGLEDIFRSHEFGRQTEDAEDGQVSGSVPGADAVFAREFGRLLTPVPERALPAQPSGGEATSGEPRAEDPSTATPRRPARFVTMVSVGALVALAVVGIMAAADHHPQSNVSTQGQHRIVRPASPNAGPTALPAPGGSLTAQGGSRGPSSGAGGEGRLASGNAPGGGHVSLVGPATFTGTPSPSPSVAPPGGSSGATGSPPPPSGGTGPAAPVVGTVGSAVSAVGSSVTTATSQIASSVPVTAPTVGVVNSVADALDQAVGASTE